MVHIQCKEGVGIVEVHRPGQLNALNSQTIDELQKAVDTVKKLDAIRCVVFRGGGQDAFVAGADIREMNALSPPEAEDFSKRGCALMDSIEALEIPVIAAINGYALGGGLELALACDMRIAAQNAILGLPEASLGIFPGWNGMRRLQKIAGYPAACRLIFSAERIGAAQALALGIVDEVCKKEELMHVVMQTARRVSANAPLAVRRAKYLLRHSTENISASFGELFATDDQKTRMQNFLCGKKQRNVQEK